MSTYSLFEECKIEAVQLSREEKNQIEVLNKTLYHELASEIKDFSFIKKEISNLMSNDFTQLSYFAVKIELKRFPSGLSNILTHYAIHVGYDHYSDKRMSLESAQDIFLTDKYGKDSLVDLLKEKLDDPFRLVVRDNLWITIEWNEETNEKKKKGGCNIV